MSLRRVAGQVELLLDLSLEGLKLAYNTTSRSAVELRPVCLPLKAQMGVCSCGSLGGRQDCSLTMAKRDWSQATSHFKSTTTGQRLMGLLHETCG